MTDHITFEKQIFLHDSYSHIANTLFIRFNDVRVPFPVFSQNRIRRRERIYENIGKQHMPGVIA